MSAKAVKEMVPSQASGVYRGLHKDVQGNEVAVPPKIGATIYIIYIGCCNTRCVLIVVNYDLCLGLQTCP